MGTFFLQKGLVIRRQGELLEFASRTPDELYFEEPSSGQRVTIPEPDFWIEYQKQTLSIVEAFSSSKQLLTSPVSDPAQFLNVADIPDRYQEDLQRRLAYVRGLMKRGVSIGQKPLIERESKLIANEINDPQGAPSAPTICRWWRDFRDGNGDVCPVVSKNAYRKPPVRLDTASEQFLQDKIDTHYLVRTRTSVANAFNKYHDDLTAENNARRANGLPILQEVAERTFYTRVNALPPYDVMAARFGREQARKHFKMIKGHLPADYPLDAVEIDHTPMNLYVIDDLAYLPLGRPWLTAIKDRFSGVLLGFYVSFQQTGLASIFGAIKHSLQSHQMAYARWPDLVNPWPAFGRGVLYVSDRGADFASLRYRTAITALGAQYEYCEVRTPWLKGSIERFFRTLEQTFFESLPGRTFSSLQERGDYDSVKHAVIRFSTLIYLLHKWAADYHNIFPSTRKNATPLELWNEGIALAPAPYPSDVDQLNIVLGLRQSGALSHEGIRFNWLNYADDSLAELMKKLGRDRQLEFVVSIEDLGHIHVKEPGHGSYLKVPCTRPEYASGLTLFQHKYLVAEARGNATSKKASKLGVDELMETRTRIASELQQEVLHKETSMKSKLARIAGVNSNSALKGAPQTITNIFGGQSVVDVPESFAREAPITNVPRYAWGT